ncbi:hypothetical protein DH2020_034287 [Rehmannia glutinosa]|uniref:Uncharacterized protein n=1 Tax=Rehmannia glutinosa TaxID=99300 RepID=A0ABR0VDS3_REHGL
MSCFVLPAGVCKQICMLFSNFWWGTGEEGKSKIHWRDWKKLTVPKKEGGLGFHDLTLFNEALIVKQLWRILSNPNLLVSKVLKAKYFPNGNLIDAKIGSNASWLWRSWLGFKETLKKGLRYEIGDGRTIKIWEDPWIPTALNFKPLKQAWVEESPHRVADLLTCEGRVWNLELIQNIFLDDDCNKILMIKGMSKEKRDKWFWQFDSKGLYSVKSTYNHLVLDKVRRLEGGESSWSYGNKKTIRDRSWKLQIKGKIKHFIWKCFSGILPTNCCLNKRE